MNDELTRLRAIRDAVNKFDTHQLNASIDWEDSEVCPEYEHHAMCEEDQAREALELAIQLTRKELK